MRILLVADIHGNWPALEAVIREPHDLCLCLGDLVDYGLDPEPCIAWVRDKAHVCVRGNHDHGVAQNVNVNGVGKSGLKYLTGVTRSYTRSILGPDDIRYLGRLPVSKRLTLMDARFLMVHASPRDPLDEYAPADIDFWRRRLQPLDVDVVCVGHTHHPYVLEVDGKLVLNPGSVGQPRDGDPRASYAILENNKVELKRVEYPVERTLERVRSSDLSAPDRDLLCEVFRRGQSVLMNGHRPASNISNVS